MGRLGGSKPPGMALSGPSQVGTRALALAFIAPHRPEPVSMSKGLAFVHVLPIRTLKASVPLETNG